MQIKEYVIENDCTITAATGFVGVMSFEYRDAQYIAIAMVHDESAEKEMDSVNLLVCEAGDDVPENVHYIGSAYGKHLFVAH